MSSFPIDEYLEKIRYGDSAAINRETLQKITTQQVFEIPFENIDAFTKKPFSIEMPGLVQKLVRSQRGGYCFEVNLLLHEALKALGFDCVPVLARVLYRPTHPFPPLTHMFIWVRDPEGKKTDWIADIGFGGPGLLAPMPMKFDREEKQFGENFRLVKNETFGYVVQKQMGIRWRDLYGFLLRPADLIDLEVSNFYVTNHPTSTLGSNLICALPHATGKVTLFNRDFNHTEQGKVIKKETLSNSMVSSYLKDYFRIDYEGPLPLP